MEMYAVNVNRNVKLVLRKIIAQNVVELVLIDMDLLPVNVKAHSVIMEPIVQPVPNPAKLVILQILMIVQVVLLDTIQMEKYAKNVMKDALLVLLMEAIVGVILIT